MGMYDNIICKYPLPMPDDPKGYTGSYDFQTKDLDLILGLYVIDKNGQLSIQRKDGEWVQGNKKSDSLIGTLGYFKTTKEWLEELNTTTTTVFYDYQHSQNTDYDYFIEYEAIFVNGKLTSIKLIKFEAKDNSERKRKDIEFDKKLEEHRKFINTWKYKYFAKPYNRIISFVFRKTNKISQNLSRILYKIENKIKI
jgi:hypothetical protein